MRVMVLVKASLDGDTDFAPTDWTKDMLAAMGRFNDDLRRAGVLVAAEGLKPSAHGRRIAFDGPERSVIPGPFPNTTDLVAGYWLWNVKDMDEAVAWAVRCPNPMPGPSVLEIRPLYEAADLDAARA